MRRPDRFWVVNSRKTAFFSGSRRLSLALHPAPYLVHQLMAFFSSAPKKLPRIKRHSLFILLLEMLLTGLGLWLVFLW